MAIDLSPEGEVLLSEYHLATLSTIAPSGLIHAVAVGFTLSDGVVRVITSDGSQKVRNVERDGRATVAQVAGPQWISIAGHAVVSRDPERVAHAVALYAARYRQPRPNPQRVVIELHPEKVLGSAGLFASSDAPTS
ncbi:PPOX class F420-dependent enzyme [Serinibacter arcticus]|uniref:PPOX class F420-dependent enzyme n=1 Tax=Serinibacter arcticus TaxID=1655435 RepID=A0A2U1ZZI1_9MICO|nr:PPOX class F420-dependent oxidoreductase [Serinibacter arcticus]PWD52387.1 PPOX class F420-dependent enzyme [Serinibacter arcticus]